MSGGGVGEVIGGARFEIRQADGRVVHGYVQGSGGVVQAYPDALDRMHLAVRRASRGHALNIYEPETGCCIVYPGGETDSERAVVDLRGAVVSLDEAPQMSLDV